MQFTETGQYGIGVVAQPSPTGSTHAWLDHIARRALDRATADGITSRPEIGIAQHSDAGGEVVGGLRYAIWIVPLLKIQSLQSLGH